MADRTVTVTRDVDATPERIFDLLADFRRHQEIDGSDTVTGALDGPDRLSKGARFGMSMRIGLPYVIQNTVVEFEEGRRIAWRHFAGHRWRYELEPLDGGGTRVAESFDWSRSPVPWFYELVGYPEKHRGNMRRTLERLEEVVTGG